MGLQIIEKDITTLELDAIVNAANSSLLGGGGVDGAIHKAAGPDLLKECRTLNGCAPGEAKITKGYNLKAKHVIHTVGPVWQGGGQGEEDFLRNSYQNSLKLAVEHHLESIAFPLISAGAYGYPKDEAMKIALEEIKSFLKDHDLQVYMVILGEGNIILSKQRKESIDGFIRRNYKDDESLLKHRELYSVLESEAIMSPTIQDSVKRKAPITKRSLDHVVAELEESFSEHLMRLIRIQDKTDVEIYKKANLDRKLFSKIKNNKAYKPSKSTALALAVGLELNLDDTKDLLLKAGYALSPSSRSDLIITYFLQEEIFDIYEINEALFAFEEALLGAW